MKGSILVHSNDPSLVRRLEALVRQVGEFGILESSGTIAGIGDAIKTCSPEIALLDLGPELTLEPLCAIARANHCKLILWGSYFSPEFALEAMANGVRGILRTSRSPTVHLECLRKVSAGEVWFERILFNPVRLAGHPALNGREQQILGLLSQGLKNSEIAMSLAVSEGTVKFYLARLFQKFGAKDRFELALYGLKNSAGGQWTTGPVSEQTCAIS